MNKIENLYINRLPSHGYATNDLEKGIRMLPTALAIKKSIIQHNWKHSLSWLVYDLDSPESAMVWDDQNAPPPNIIAINKDNGHAHYFYGLENPVHNYTGASQKAIRYMAAIDVALTELLNADPGYSKLVSKNPTHDNWLTIYNRNELYDLEELADYLDLNPYKDRRRRLPDVGMGRNCTLFENLRRWAYTERRQGYLSEDMYYQAVKNHGLALNSQFSSPLSHGEVRATAKSISQWTWKNMSSEGFKARQKALSTKATIKRKQQAMGTRQRVIEAREQCPTLSQADLAAMLEVNQATVSRHLKDYASPISDNMPTKATGGSNE